ncbi:MAG: hypothetical protein Q8L68_03560 [Methylococcales bacterium]|nr:hypothetical protein [Methylococcales bacterium]
MRLAVIDSTFPFAFEEPVVSKLNSLVEGDCFTHYSEQYFAHDKSNSFFAVYSPNLSTTPQQPKLIKGSLVAVIMIVLQQQRCYPQQVKPDRHWFAACGGRFPERRAK